MGTRNGRSGRSGWALAFLLTPALLSLLGTVGSTSAIFSDNKQGAVTIGAIGPTPPTVTPDTVTLALHVGDRCETAPLAEVRTSSNWRVDLSVTASGGPSNDDWLRPEDVQIMPTNIGPGEVAIVFFTKAAVQGPTAITGQVVVTAQPGGHQTVITLGGSVTQPADASLPDDLPHPPGCEPTPRPKGLATDSTEPESSLTGEAPTEEDPVEEAPVEEDPVEEDPAEEAPAEETPAEESVPAEQPDSGDA